MRGRHCHAHPEAPRADERVDIATLEEILAALSELRRSPARVLVVAGSGKVFSAGADQAEMVPRGPAEWERIVDRYLDPLRALLSPPIPTVAKIHADCVGAGASLAMACDLRIMWVATRIAFPLVKIGLAGCHKGASYFLPRLVGFGPATDLMMTGRLISAEEAERISLVTRVAPPETFEEEASSLAQTLGAGAPRVLRATKEAAYRSLDRDREAEFDFETFPQAQCLQSADHREGVAAFQAKRPGLQGGARAMTDFSLTEGQESFRRALRNFAEREIAPLADAADRSGTYPRELFRKLGALGYLAVAFPENHGGSGGDAVTFTILAEELARASAGIALGVYVQVALALSAAAAFGTENQKRRPRKPGLRGETIGAWAFAEADAGSDPGGIRTRAVRDGDPYVVNGTKMYIANGTFADFAVTTVSTAPEKGMRGLSLLVVERGMPGFRVARRIEMLGVRGRNGRAGVRKLPRSGDKPPGRRGHGLRGSDARSHARAHHGGGVRGGPRHGRLGAGARLRQGAASLRPPNRFLPGDRREARGHDHGDRSREASHLEGRVEGSEGRATRSGSVPGQALRDRGV